MTQKKFDDIELIRKSIIEFAQKELNDNVSEDDATARFPIEKWRKCAEMDLLALLSPQRYGGCEEDLLTGLQTIEALSYGCKDSGLVHSILTQLCCLTQLSIFGSEEQQQALLPALIRGHHIAAQAITEPHAGSDLLALQTTAVENKTHYTLNGSKTFISNAPVADIIIVFAVTNPERRKFGGISCFIVEKEQKGLSVGTPLEKMGLRTLQNGELFIENLHIPKERCLGEPGQGMIIFNEIIEWERLLFSAAHIGTMERILDNCISYAKTRKQYGQPIGKFQSISNSLADMKVNIELGKSILHKTADMKVRNCRISMEASIAKLFISESLKNACLRAVQIFGGYGYMKEYEIERDLRDSIAATIYSGTSEIQKNIISRLMGL